MMLLAVHEQYQVQMLKRHTMSSFFHTLALNLPFCFDLYYRFSEVLEMSSNRT